MKNKTNVRWEMSGPNISPPRVPARMYSNRRAQGCSLSQNEVLSHLID